MKLEPVGYYNPELMDEVASGTRSGGAILWTRQSDDNDRVPAYAIPDGCVVVPVSLLEEIVQSLDGTPMSMRSRGNVRLANDISNRIAAAKGE